MKKVALFGSTMILAAGMALAQAPEPPPHPHGPGGPGGPGEMRGFGPGGEFRGMEGRTVAGSPYSAQIVSTSTQTLADGSHITRTLNATVARDSQGRTYRQQVMQNLGPVSTGSHTFVFLRDPVAGQSHVLSVEEKTDMASSMPQRRRGPQSITPPPPSSASAPQIHARKGETVESLGSQMMEGVMADGTRITRTIPAGTIGNEHDLKIVSEIWYSKDLQMVVMSKHTDPRMGESTFKMTNITRTEPDATLFQVPAGFNTTTTGRRAR